MVSVIDSRHDRSVLPNRRYRRQDENAPTLTYNTIGRHISKMVYTKVVTK